MNSENWLHPQRIDKLVACSDSLNINQIDVGGNTIVYKASAEGNLYLIQVLLRHPNIDLNKQAIDGSTPLYIASQKQHREIVTVLIKALGILVNKGNAEGISPLQVAAKNGHLSITRLLLSHNDIDPNQADYQDITPLIAAANEGHSLVITEILLHPRIEANKATWSGETALFFACKKQDLNVTRVLLKCPQTDINLLDENGKHAQTYAENNSVIIDAFNSRISLIHSGHSCCSDEQKSGMQIAARHGDWKKIKTFLKCPAMNVNDGYESDLTPLYIAVREEKSIVVQMLLEFPTINVNQVVNGENALLVATELGSLEVVTMLLDHPEIDTNVVKRGDQGNPLYIASERGFDKIVKQLLVQSQIEVNDVFGSKRRTALITATATKNMKITEMLLLCPKVNINITDLLGKRAIDHAANWTLDMFVMRDEILSNKAYNHTCCVDASNKLMRASNVDNYKAIRGLAKCPNININIADYKGRTPLYLASMMNNLKAVKELLTLAGIDTNKGRSLDAKTPFSVSSENGHGIVMQYLLNHTMVNVNVGWELDNWPSHIDEVVAPLRNSIFGSSGISFEGGIS